MRGKPKKEITAKTVVRAIITGYISYGILLGFLVFIVAFGVNKLLGVMQISNPKIVSITVPLIGVIVLYFILHLISKLSIHDVFRRCKTNPDNLPKIVSRLNLFIIICIMFEVIATVGILVINFSNQEQAIEIAVQQYSTIHSAPFVSKLENEMHREFYESKSNTLISTIILELGIVVSWFSVIPLQKKLIEQYNKS